MVGGRKVELVSYVHVIRVVDGLKRKEIISTSRFAGVCVWKWMLVCILNMNASSL